ncbi:hypothetical protein CC80DRAFT_139983 [Byssothecium circinans]|uniref:Uncharacterized protein n=1 Tax=Byssothecium circinans TaxID=147558 RepID=A0A6A5TX14_9PLEO|nr:hypothetical protein CC80DRAFT_139983 [Byssothecium circinans]
MLAFQTVGNKRRRDSSDSEDERWLKRARSLGRQESYGASIYPTSMNLPLRTTPSPSHMVPGLEAMTPAQSDHSDGDSPASIEEDLPVATSPVDYAMQMDDDDFDMVASQPPDSPFVATNFRPAKLNPELFGRDSAVNATGRIPTPIYPTFHNSGMSGLGYPSSGMAGGMGLTGGHLSVPAHNPPLMQPPRKQGMSMDHDRSRRMPSPISEDEDIPDTPTAFAQSQLSRLSVTSHHTSTDGMDAEMTSTLAPPTPARGRKRSGALTGSGRFSMGYREDCERCRQRVPGHYSHFLS